MSNSSHLDTAHLDYTSWGDEFVPKEFMFKVSFLRSELNWKRLMGIKAFLLYDTYSTHRQGRHTEN